MCLFIGRLLLLGVVTLVLLIGVAWAFGAFWFDFPFSALRRPLAAAFGLGAIGALVFVRPRWRAQVGSPAQSRSWPSGSSRSPSNTGDGAEVAEAPTSKLTDRIVIHNFRNFELQQNRFPPRWETKTVSFLICDVDFFTNFWAKAHLPTFVSFDFGPDGYVCISIETRPKKGQGYSPIAGLYRQYELYYVIGDERDIVRLRTNFRLEAVYLYHLIPATPRRYRALFPRLRQNCQPAPRASAVV